MQVVHPSTLPFPGWCRFREAVHAVAPEVALLSTQRLLRAQCEQSDGIFMGIPPIFPTNLHVVVKEWVLNLSAENFPATRQSLEFSEIYPILAKACRQISALRENHPALRDVLILPPSMRFERLLRKLWFHHLEQIGIAWAPKYELGRSQRMFVEIWSTLRQSGKVTLDGHLATAFLDMPRRLFLTLAVWASSGHVEDARTLLQDTAFSESQISAMLEASFPPLEVIKEQLRRLPNYPCSIQNVFHRHPIMRAGQWGLIAPLPYLTLQWWDLQNLFENLDLALENAAGTNAAANFYGAFGNILEEYVQDILSELSDASEGMSFVAPFNFMPGHESPDGFLYRPSGETLVFESKCYRVPQRDYENVTVPGFIEWFEKLLGSNSRMRAPLEQGLAFFDELQRGNQAIAAAIPGASTEKSLYVIVSYEDVPFFVGWRSFRSWYRNWIDENVRALWDKTLVISIRDLEILAAAGTVAGSDKAPPRPFSPFDILTEYLAYLHTERDAAVIDGATALKGSLGSWICDRWPAVNAAEPKTISEARERLTTGAQHAGFPMPSPLLE